MTTLNTQRQHRDLSPIPSTLPPSDEIDLRVLLHNLLSQWRLMAVIVALAAAASVVYALLQPNIYQVESTLTAPTKGELANLPEQTLVEVSPKIALDNVVDLIISPRVQAEVFEQSALHKKLAEHSDLTSQQLFLSIRPNLKIKRHDHEFFVAEELADDTKKEIRITLESRYPSEATEYINTLINYAQTKTIANFHQDVGQRKQEENRSINEQIAALTKAETALREAKIAKLSEQNAQKIAALELELSLLEIKAREDRLIKIQVLKEALKTAQELNIVEPVRWFSNNSNAGSDPNPITLNWIKDNYPTYYRGTKHLSAEIAMLENRENDLLYVDKATDIKTQINEIKADPVLTALKARTNDTIYIENYAELINKQQLLQSQPMDFSTAKVANIVQPAIVPVKPFKPNRKLIVTAGLILGVFLAVFIGLIRIALQPEEKG